MAIITLNPIPKGITELVIKPYQLKFIEGYVECPEEEATSFRVYSGLYLIAICDMKFDATRLKEWIDRDVSFEETLAIFAIEVGAIIAQGKTLAFKNLSATIEQQGTTMGSISFCRNLARKFEDKYRGEKWEELDWYDAIDNFLKENL